MSKPWLSRRTLLRGAGCIALGLPWLEAMGSQSTTPLRFVQGFGGFSLRPDATEVPDPFRIPAPGESAVGRQSLGEMVSDVTFVRNLRIPQATGGGPVPAGGRFGGNFSFHWHCNPMFAGLRQQGDAFDTTVTGPSADQLAAAQLGQASLFPSLTVRTQAKNYSKHLPNRMTPSFTRLVDGSVSPITPITSPQSLFRSLVYGIVPEDPAAIVQAEKDRALRQSVLDHVDRRMSGLVNRLSGLDQQRLERHFDEVRDLERRIQQAPVLQEAGCAIRQEPTDPPIGERYSGEIVRSQSMRELVRMALACDLTRSVGWMQTAFQPALDAAPMTGVGDSVHGIHHTRGAYEHALVIKWHLEEWAAFLRLLKHTPEADGSTLLDHCALVYLIEGGNGLPGTDLGSHNTDNMTVLVSGGAGGLVRGAYVDAVDGANHPANVSLTALRACGVQLDQLGEVTGEIEGLR